MWKQASTPTSKVQLLPRLVNILRQYYYRRQLYES